jgi:hypothetical protein
MLLVWSDDDDDLFGRESESEGEAVSDARTKRAEGFQRGS